jgi:hypothetical protein
MQAVNAAEAVLQQLLHTADQALRLLTKHATTHLMYLYA